MKKNPRNLFVIQIDKGVVNLKLTRKTVTQTVSFLCNITFCAKCESEIAVLFRALTEGRLLKLTLRLINYNYWYQDRTEISNGIAGFSVQTVEHYRGTFPQKENKTVSYIASLAYYTFSSLDRQITVLFS